MKDVYVGNERIRLAGLPHVGKGGEAEVYLWNRYALKVFKEPNHPDYEGQPHEQKGAAVRIETHQKKLRQFPKGLPASVIVPRKLLTSSPGGRIVGYAMDMVSGADRLVQYSDPGFHRAGLSNRTVTESFKRIHDAVAGTHAAKVVIGDFNDLNVLVRGGEIFMIDADSFQFGSYLSTAFTMRFVDPMLCAGNERSPVLTKPHGEGSDWFAFNALLMQSLLCVGPWGGIYRPKDPKNKLPQDARSLHRVSVFRGEVKYPLPAIPYASLSDDLLHYLFEVFEKDRRGPFPLGLIESLDWKKCGKCGIEYARYACPICDPNAVQPKETTMVRGKITATRVFRRSGSSIVFATEQNGTLKWIYYENGAYRREDDSVVLAGPQDPHVRFRIQGNRTLYAKEQRLVTIAPGSPEEIMAVDSFLNVPTFDANGLNRYWLANGRLMKDGQFGSEYVGNALAGGTFFWVGPKFGFGFYRAGQILVGFVFDAAVSGINDSVQLPPMKGQLVDSTCFFSKERCWFLWSEQDKGRRVNNCVVLDPLGAVVAHDSAPEGADDEKAWLSTLRGKCAVGTSLIAATEDGLVRVSVAQGAITVAEKFADTESFVSPGNHLFAGAGGVYVVKGYEITLMKLNRS